MSKPHFTPDGKTITANIDADLAKQYRAEIKKGQIYTLYPKLQYGKRDYKITHKTATTITGCPVEFPWQRFNLNDLHNMLVRGDAVKSQWEGI